MANCFRIYIWFNLTAAMFIRARQYVLRVRLTFTMVILSFKETQKVTGIGLLSRGLLDQLYLFEPENTDEELNQIEKETWRIAEAERQQVHPKRQRTSGNFLRSLLSTAKWEGNLVKSETFNARLGTLAVSTNDNDASCVIATSEFVALINITILQTAFLLPKINWSSSPSSILPNALHPVR